MFKFILHNLFQHLILLFLIFIGFFDFFASVSTAEPFLFFKCMILLLCRVHVFDLISSQFYLLTTFYFVQQDLEFCCLFVQFFKF